jgi:hypothetical protein
MDSGKPIGSRRRVFRFTLATLLFVVLLIAGFLAGLRAGFQRGYVAGELQRENETPVARVYPVASLVLPTPDSPPENADYDTLIDLITSSIAPESWDTVGGPGSIEAFPASRSVVITQTPPVHERITSLLQNLEQQRGAPGEDKASAP